MKKIVTYILFSLSAATAAHAQGGNASASQMANLQLCDVLDISFTNTNSATGSNININLNNVNKLANGVNSSKQTLKVRSNKNFAVSVKTSSAHFTYSGSVSPAPTMPANVLKLKVSNNATGGSIVSPFNSFGSLSASSQSALTNCTQGSNNTFKVQYKATPGFDYPGVLIL